MHYAYPSRKSSQPPQYAARSRGPYWLRRLNPRLIAIALGVLGGILLLSQWIGGIPSREKIPPGTPPVVIVTMMDQEHKDSLKQTIMQNRIEYAERHGYATFFPNTTDYNINDSPRSWARVPALRHAMTLFPYSTYFFQLDAHVLITNPSLSLESHIMDKERLERIMIVNIPVVPPDSVIKTFAHLKGDRIDLVLTQDKDGLSQNSIIVRRGEWAKFFLDAWFDPLYRSYNFQKAEGHALEHIVQWHGTILAKLALVPQNVMNSYASNNGRNPAKEGLYTEGDFVTNFGDCDKNDRDCEREMDPYLDKMRKRGKAEE